jgi:hypothetical protein
MIMSKQTMSKPPQNVEQHNNTVEPLVMLVDKVLPKLSQDFKLLVAVPATKTSHLPYQNRVLDSIKRACDGYAYDLYVGESNELGWQHVVDQFNLVADRVVNENYDYVLIIESDVFIAENALQHMLGVDSDVTVAVVPNHSYPNHPQLHELHKNLVCVAWFTHPNQLWFRSCTMDEVKDKILTFKDGPLLAGTGCLLVKRRVFESGIRFINDLNHASYDIIFWRDVAKAGFSGASDGFVVCEHLGD